MDLQHAVAVSTLPGISRPHAAAVFRSLREGPDGDSVTLTDIVQACAPALDAAPIVAGGLEQAAALLDAARTSGIVAIPCWSAAYPPLLQQIRDPPPVLWVHGRADALLGPAVAIVGSRAATPYALEVAARLAGELAGRGVVVISGMARGVDGAAHRGCLAAAGRTVAVLGSGPDVIYPSEHRELAVSVCKNGCLVSELGPGAPPLQEHFPLRNRLISGISVGVVVVEASEKSGSLITARCALEQGRDVMAVPGSILSGRNRGSHALLKDGAKVVETADDILEGLGWPGGVVTAGPNGDKSPDENDLLARLAPGEAYDLDQLSGILGLPGPDLLARLTGWEVGGRMVRLAGGRFGLKTYG